MANKVVYGRTAYAGFARALASKLGLKVHIEDGSPCIDAAGTIRLPDMNTYQTAEEFAVTCGVLVHEMAHQFYNSHSQIDPNRSRLEHDCLNAALDVADETWISKWFDVRQNTRPGELLTGSNESSVTANWKQYTDWANDATHAWKVLCAGILGARLPMNRNVKRMQRHTALHSARHGVNARACFSLLRSARLGKKDNGDPTPRRFAKLIRIAKKLAAILAPFAPQGGESCGAMIGGDVAGAVSQGTQQVPGNATEATTSDGVAIAEGKGTVDGAFSPNANGGRGVGSSGSVTDFRADSFAALYPAVKRVAQRIAVDGDGLARHDGLNNGPTLGQVYRIATDGQALSRWSKTDNADGVSVAVVLDCSGSMSYHLGEVAGVARAFAQGLRECGHVESLCFGDKVEKSDDFSRVRVLGGTQTSLAINEATKRLADRTGAKWIVLITDGQPDCQTATNAAAAAARAKGVKILAVGLNCTITMPGCACAVATDVNHLAIKLDAAVRMIEAR